MYIESNLVLGTFNNGRRHILHEFYPPDYKFIKVPKYLVSYYLNYVTISHISLVLKDQNRQLFDLREEPVSVCLLIQNIIDGETTIL